MKVDYFFGIVNQDPSDYKSNRLHVDIFKFCFHSLEAYSIDSSKLVGTSPEVLNFNRLLLKFNWFSPSSCIWNPRYVDK